MTNPAEFGKNAEIAASQGPYFEALLGFCKYFLLLSAGRFIPPNRKEAR